MLPDERLFALMKDIVPVFSIELSVVTDTPPLNSELLPVSNTILPPFSSPYPPRILIALSIPVPASIFISPPPSDADRPEVNDQSPAAFTESPVFMKTLPLPPLPIVFSVLICIRPPIEDLDKAD